VITGEPPASPAAPTTMSDYVPFHPTAYGRCYYEHRLPDLLRLLTELNTSLQKVANRMETKPE